MKKYNEICVGDKRYKVSFKPRIWHLTVNASSKKEAEKLALKEWDRLIKEHKGKENSIYEIKLMKKRIYKR